MLDLTIIDQCLNTSSSMDGCCPLGKQSCQESKCCDIQTSLADLLTTASSSIDPCEGKTENDTWPEEYTIQRVVSNAICTSFIETLPGRKGDNTRSESQDSVFSFCDSDAACHGVFDGHGKDGARISQFVSGIFENALRFVVGTFQNMLNHSRGRQDVCEWNDWKTLPNWVDRGREIFGNDLEKILMAKCEWSDRGVTDVAKLEIAIALLFSIVQDEIVEKDGEMFDASSSGSTGIILLRLGPEVWISWVGDSKCIGLKYQWGTDDQSPKVDKSAKLLSPHAIPFYARMDCTEDWNANVEFYSLVESRDHCPSIPSERERIERKGGNVVSNPTNLIDSIYRLMPYGIAMSRSFGDIAATQWGLIHDAEIFHIIIPWNQLDKSQSSWAFIMASDGLWDTVSVEDVVQKLIGTAILDSFRYASFDNWESQETISYDIRRRVSELLHSFCYEAQETREDLVGWSDDTSAILFFTF